MSPPLPPVSVLTHAYGVRLALGLALGVLVEITILVLLQDNGANIDSAHIIGFSAAWTVSVLLLVDFRSVWTALGPIVSCLRMLTIFALSLFLGGGMLGIGIGPLQLSTPWAAAIAAAVAIGASIFAFRDWLPGPPARDHDPNAMARHFAVQIIVYVALLRLLYLGLPELLYEEAYYWNYAQHLDIGYLDHPPMVAWIIATFTGLLGDNAFAVRAGAYLSWVVAAWFVWRLGKEVGGAGNALRALLLFSTLPFFVGNGLLMTPDAPLMACWAAALYYLYRMLVTRSEHAWVGLGIAFGLGMLSKYTMAFLGLAALFAVLLDRHSRTLLVRPPPWLAVGAAVIIFSPVLIWNAGNDWASFTFQGSRRVSGDTFFTFPNLLGSLLVWLTPAGVLAMLPILSGRVHATTGEQPADRERRGLRVLLVATMVPLAILTFFSITREVRFHWTGTLWLGALPYLALTLRAGAATGLLRRVIAASWRPTLLLATLAYGAILHYLTLGLPGMGYPPAPMLIGWHRLGCEIQRVAAGFKLRTGDEPLVIGMDRLRIASGLAWYRSIAVACTPDTVTLHPIPNTTAGQVLGYRTRMYERWLPVSEQFDKTLLLVDNEPGYLQQIWMPAGLVPVGEIGTIELSRNGRQVSRYYYRFAEWQSAAPLQESSP